MRNPLRALVDPFFDRLANRQRRQTEPIATGDLLRQLRGHRLIDRDDPIARKKPTNNSSAMKGAMPGEPRFNGRAPTEETPLKEISFLNPIALIVVLGIFPMACLFAQAVQKPGAPTPFRTRIIRPIELGQVGDSSPAPVSIESMQQSVDATSPVVIAPTRSSFLASWNAMNGITGYRLDVSTSRAFDSCMRGYQGLDVGNVTSRIASELSPGTTYYYRVRAYDARGEGSNSDIMTATTTTGAGLVIIPTFDSSILGNPNSAAIQSVINQAIAIYQSLFRDPITVSILFRYSDRRPNGDLFPSNIIGDAIPDGYDAPWNTYTSSLGADAKTGNDAIANASLPTSPLSTNIVFTSANGRALGFNTPGTMDAAGNVGAGTFDGIVTLNSDQLFSFSRPPSSNSFDAMRLTEAGIDLVLGSISYLDFGGGDFGPQDIFSWAAPSNRNTTTSGSRYFSINSGNTNIVNFNQSPGTGFSFWQFTSCPQANPYVYNAIYCRGQFSDVTATSPEGINLDVIGYDLDSPNPTPTPAANLANISTRLRVDTGDSVLIGGFIVVTGTQPKRVIVRAIGPSLPVAGALADPVLELRNSSGGLIASNDDWRTDQEAEIIATGIPPNDNLESAIVATLPANNSAYTAIVRGYNGGTGIGLVEAYDLDNTVNSKLGNISTRGFVGTGDNVMIGGFIVDGQIPTRVIMRAIGPSLPIGGKLADPILELHDGNGTLLQVDDNWRTGGQESEIIATGIPPSNDLESAIVRTLAPGNYTAIVRGVNDTTGVALVEAYDLGPP